MVRRGNAVQLEELKRIDQSFSKAAPKFAQVNPPRASDVDKLITFIKQKFKSCFHSNVTYRRTGNFFWIKSPALLNDKL